MTRNRIIVAGAWLAFDALGCSSSGPRRDLLGDVGDPCTTEYDCLPELICRPDDTCGPCTEDDQCPTDLVCRSDGQCGNGGYGAPCEVDDDCNAELACGDDGTCRERGPGDPCDVDDDCRWDLVCRSDGLCGFGGVGEPCTIGDDCRSDLVCRGDGFCGQPGLGDPCTPDAPCHTGLVCGSDGTCGPAGATAEGEPCTYTEDCEDGLACLWERDERGVPRTVCRPAGTAGEGEFCASTADCERGLVCATEGFGGRCTAPARDGDLGFPCDTLVDCAAGLVCGTDGTCVLSIATGGGPGFRLWDGVDCAPRDAANPTRFHFEVPRGPLASGHDFFRLPWPNDARRTADGHLDLTDFPHPATAGLPVDVLDRFLRAAEAGLTGFGTNGAIFFRSSNGIDWSTLTGGGDDPTIYFVDLTPPSTPGDPHGRLGFGWAASTGGGRYLCPDWLAVRPPSGVPLLPGRGYAVVITTGVLDGDGEAMVRDPDFEAVLATARPTGEPELGRAWDAYAPFRAFLADESIDPATILVAAAFTTQDVPATLDAVRRTVEGLPAPPATDVVRCSASVTSPCDDGLTGAEHVRGCFGEDPAYAELHGRFRTPIFQEGTRPYAQPADGGGFTWDAGGSPETHGEEQICFALTVPTGGPMPAEGWPVVLYEHGTGGSYRSFVDNGVAQMLSGVTLADGSVQRFAVLSFEAPMHGARQGAATGDPALLFFNFANPDAAYGNVLQGVVDGWQATKLLGATSWDDASSPTGAAISFDATRTYFYGHSQGATHGIPGTAYDPAIAAAVFSGAGGLLIDTLLTKSSPYDIAGALRMALADIDLGGTHPALTIFQTWLEVADPINYGRYFVWRPFTPPPRSVLMTYGLGDTYSPPATIASLAATMGLAVAEPPLEAIGFLDTVPLPATANRNIGGVPVTAVLTQHAPSAGVDGHFVATDNADARHRIAEFLGTAARDGVPTVVP